MHRRPPRTAFNFVVERIDEEKNMAPRYYVLSIEQTLFGEPSRP